jgi:phosphohistidine phosphatase
MHRLILLRHGKAERESSSGDDFDRRLAGRGVRDSKAVGETLADLGLAPDLALVSPSARTRETWAVLAETFPKAEVRYEDGLYHADTEAVRRLVDQFAGQAGTIMVVGHNPGLQDLTTRLLVEGKALAGLIARAQQRFPTAAAAVFLIDAEGRPFYDGLFLPRHGGAD